MRRVAVYTRRSTDEEHQPYSIEAQTVRLDAYIASQPGWVKAATFTDNASAKDTHRPGLRAALAAARSGRIDVLLVLKVDRFSRRQRDLVTLVEELTHLGVAFVSATEAFDTSTPAGRAMLQMLGTFAEFEREMIIDRVVAGMERHAAAGRWPGGVHPDGYTLDPDTKRLVVDEERAGSSARSSTSTPAAASAPAPSPPNSTTAAYGPAPADPGRRTPCAGS